MGFWQARGWDVDHAVSAVASHIDGDIARPTGRDGVSVPRSPPDGGAATPAEPQDWPRSATEPTRSLSHCLSKGKGC